MAIGLMLLMFALAFICFGVSAFFENRANKYGEAAYGKERWKEICEKRKEYNSEENVIERERLAAIASQRSSEPWAIRYSTSPCPYCGHYKVRYAKWEDKSMSVAFWGIASQKLGANFKCEHCTRMWE